MPLPFILWGAAAALAATGVMKGVGAKNDLDEARRIGERSQDRHRHAISDLDNERNTTNNDLQSLGKLKVDILSNQIQHLVNVVKKGRSQLQGFEGNITTDELRQYERMATVALEIESGIGAGAVGGALAGLGAYGAVGMLATASTGTAIATLSGAAAEGAALAWLGGGSLAAGGFGVAGGMLALGGIVLGPALAIGGFMLASKAEEALTEANRYEYKVDKAIAEIQIARTGLQAIRTNIHDASNALLELVQRFDRVKVNDVSSQGFKHMLEIGKAIKGIMDIAIVDKEGAAVIGLSAQLSGFKQVLAIR